MKQPILLPYSGVAACCSWANSPETRVVGAESRFIQKLAPWKDGGLLSQRPSDHLAACASVPAGVTGRGLGKRQRLTKGQGRNSDPHPGGKGECLWVYYLVFFFILSPGHGLFLRPPGRKVSETKELPRRGKELLFSHGVLCTACSGKEVWKGFLQSVFWHPDVWEWSQLPSKPMVLKQASLSTSNTLSQASKFIYR